MTIYPFLLRLIGWAVVTVALLFAVAVAQFGPDDCYVAPGVIVCEAIV